MSRLRGSTAAVLGMLAGLVVAHAPAAGAATIGELPTSTPECLAVSGAAWLAQEKAAANAYAVPTGGGYLTSWSMALGTAGSPVGLLVLAPEGGGKFVVVALDSEHLPSPIPSGHVSTFNLATPIHVQEGDTLGLLAVPGGSACFFTTSSSEDSADLGAGTPSVGGTLSAVERESDLRLDVRAELLQSDDASLTQSVSPSTISPGALALITLEGRLSPSFALPSTITDTLPTGLTAVAASSSAGSCSVAAQTVTCNLTGGSTVTHIVASASVPGSYTNSATVSTPLRDPNPANNSASTTLSVVAPAPPPPPPSAPAPASCHPLELAGVPLSTARTILTALNCAAGTVTSNTSSTVPNGSVISDSPNSGTLPAGTAIDLIVSSGKPAGKPKKSKSKAKKHKRHKKTKRRKG